MLARVSLKYPAVGRVNVKPVCDRGNNGRSGFIRCEFLGIAMASEFERGLSSLVTEMKRFRSRGVQGLT